MTSNEDFEEVWRWLRLGACLIACVGIGAKVFGYSLDVHAPTADEISLEKEIQDKKGQEAQDKIDQGEEIKGQELIDWNQWQHGNYASNDNNNTPSGTMDQGTRGGG